jgi:hypothetical protein
MVNTAPARTPDGPEPAFTIYGIESWSAARDRLDTGDDMDPDGATLLRRAMDHVDAGWRIVREPLLWAERHREESGDYGCLLGFIEAELGEAFRSVAGSLADVVRHWPGWGRASTDDATDFLETFWRNLTLLRLATESANAPEPFRALVRRMADVMDADTSWSARMRELLAALAPEPPYDDGTGPRWAVGVLLHALASEQRQHASGWLVDDIERLYTSAGKTPPAWVGMLRREYVAEGGR